MRFYLGSHHASQPWFDVGVPLFVSPLDGRRLPRLRGGVVLTVVKPVYYCDHCKRHRITAAAILKHEPRCIYNPLRSECGWHRDVKPSAPADLALAFKDDPDVEWLRKMADGCPACMLATVVQARRLGLHVEEAWDFDYRAEVDKYREAEVRRCLVSDRMARAR